MAHDKTTGAVPQGNTAETSPRGVLVAWANEQDGWVRQIVNEVLVTGQAPTADLIATAYEILKLEKGFDEGDVPDIPSLSTQTEEASAEDELVVTRMHDVTGVNALGSDSDIKFNRGLTILFGENGTGKTGYARVLKRAAGVRTSEEILPNAHLVDPQDPPSAVIEFDLGGVAKSVTWENIEGLSPFTRISVFDSPAVALHVDNDLNYVFTPADLALFSHVTKGARGVQDLATTEASELAKGGNPFLSRFQRGTTVYPIVESLGPATDLSELAPLAEVPDNADTQRESLQEQIAALKGRSLNDRILDGRQRHQALTALAGVLGSVSTWDSAPYEEARSRVESARSEYAKARTELFQPGELAGDADDGWQQFVAAGEAYRQHLGHEDYPQEGDQCLYCRQPLDDDARTLIQKYRTFLDNTLARQLAEAERALARSALQVNATAAESARTFVATLASAEEPPAWARDAQAVVEIVEPTVEATRKGQAVPAQVDIDLSAVQEMIASDLDLLSKRLDDAEKQLHDREAELAKRQRELAELEARLELRRQLPAMTAVVRDAKRSQKLDQLARRISNTTLRSLTDASKAASEELVNRNFERLFEEEREALRGPTVRLEFHGRSGRAERKKSVASKYRPSAILSEGECKVLALADFLAESRLRGTRAPIVFDDPVNSLDYRRMSEVAYRIEKLVESHQVIVLTHSIWLTTELLARFEKKRDKCTYYTVRDTDQAKGIISAESGPRQDNPKQIGKKIRALIQNARNGDPEVQEALAEKGYEYIRAWCETFVEQELLEGVTQRYQPNVMMTKLPSIRPDEIPKANSVIEPIFDKACRYMGGHSQPTEQLHVRPTIDELQQDFTQLDEMRAAFLQGK